MAEHNQTGTTGEELAVNYLTEKGFTVLAKNWRFRNAEIDIVARKNNFISIVEVKTRSSNAFGEPSTFVNKQKQKLLIQASEWFCEQKNIDDVEINFDIISIVLKKDNTHSLEYIENAFYATM
jgi:putative endonuclease